MLIVVCALISGAAALAAAAFTARRRLIVGHRPFVGLMLASSAWSFLSALHAIVPALAAKLLVAKLQYLPISSVSLLWLLVTLRVTGRTTVDRRRLSLLTIVPLVTIGLAWTNEWHGFVWSDTSVVAGRLVYHHGTWFWIAATYNYGLLAIAMVLLGHAALRGPMLYRSQHRIMLAVACLPWLGNLLYLLKVIPIPGLDPTPLAFTLTGLLTLWALYRHHLLDLVPIARTVLIDHLADGVIVLDQRLRIVDHNPAAARLTGLSTAAHGVTLNAALPAWATRISPTLVGGGMMNVESPSQSGISVEIHSTPLQDHRKQAIGWLVTLRDVTVLREADRTLRSFFESAGVMMGIVELLTDDIMFISSNVVTAAFFGTSVDAMRGQRASTLGLTPDTIRRWQMMFEASERSGQPVQFEDMHTTSTGPVWLTATVCCIGPATTGRTRFSFVVTDITEHKRIEGQLRASQQDLETANAHLRDVARRDGLTGLRNRAAFDERLAEEIAQATRYPDVLSLLLIDVDHFKSYNDTYGHIAGDSILRSLAHIFEEHTRQHDLAARYGGEEFAIILPNTDEADALRIAERIRRAVGAASWPNRSITISVGVATGTPGIDATTLVQQADTALYAVKKTGRNQVVHVRATLKMLEMATVM